MLKKNEAISKLNALGAAGQPFSFYCDFQGDQWCIQEASDGQNQFSLSIGQEDCQGKKFRDVSFQKHPVSFKKFKEAFDQVVHQINIGNSFLTNLTFETPIETDVSLEEIFTHSSAKYKLLVPDQFVVFSPETFVRIKDNCIYSFPMKGTIDADTPNAAQVILDDIKEKAEHVTIVDLIRNDLSQVASEVSVERFRYIDRLKTNDKSLLQVSSKIKGHLGDQWKSSLGDLLVKLLPAGSISGAPKNETVKIIQNAEDYTRGFYTGICGQFDGSALDTGVMIRFIKRQGKRLLFCSGGGITSFSSAEKEYQEMIDKVYLPLG